MKTLILTFLTMYQQVISPLLNQLFWQGRACRYSISCSEFTKQAITKYGVLKGSRMSFMRFVSCQPFTKTYGNRIFS